MYLDLSLNMLDTSSFHFLKKKISLLNSKSNGIYISDSYGNPFYRQNFKIYYLIYYIRYLK